MTFIHLLVRKLWEQSVYGAWYASLVLDVSGEEGSTGRPHLTYFAEMKEFMDFRTSDRCA